MCNCGCNTCDITKSPLMLNESLAPKQILSEGLKYHMDNNKPLTEHVYRAGSENYFNLWAEARSLYSREILEITNPDDLEILTETHLGHFGIIYEIEIGDRVKASKEYGGLSGVVVDIRGSFIVVKTKEGNESYHESDLKVLNKEGKKVPLDFPMLDEGTYEEDGEDDRKYALLKVRPENYNLMIDKLQDMNINHTRHSGIDGVIKVYTDRIPDKVLYKLTHDVWVDKFVLKEAKKNNKPLNKPMRDSSGGKAYKVYVKDPKTKKIKTVRFGSGGLRAKINDKEARNAFAARHKCSTKKDKTKAGYWSCRLPRYAKLLGLKSNFGGFW
jgi:hypothetical protein